MAKNEKPRGVGALKPFSVDDPLGEKHGAQVGQGGAARGRSPGASQGSRSSPLTGGGQEGAAARLSSAQPPGERARARQRQQEKKKGGSGCLGTMVGCFVVLLGIVAVIVTPLLFLFPYAKEAYDQWDVRSTGVDAPAEVIQTSVTSMTFNDQKVHELSIRVMPPAGAPFEATLHFPLGEEELPAYAPGSRVIVRYDPADPSRITIMGPEGYDEPPADEPPPVHDPSTTPLVEPREAPSPGGNAPGSDAEEAPTSPAPPGPAAAVAPICQATFDCCMTVQGEQAHRSCSNFLQPMPTTRHCEMAIGVFEGVGQQMGRPCRAR